MKSINLLATAAVLASVLATPLLTSGAAASAFNFAATNSDTSSIVGTTYTINELPHGGNGAGVFTSTFTASGDFTATVTQFANAFGSTEQDAGFEVGFGGGGATNQFTRVNSSASDQLWGWSLNFPTPTPPIIGGDSFLNRHLSAALGIQRVGDTVNLFFDGLLVTSYSGSAFDGAATFYFVFSNNDDFGNGSAVWTDFNLTSGTSTPLPAALPLFATGLGVLGLIAKRRKRKNAAAITAA